MLAIAPGGRLGGYVLFKVQANIDFINTTWFDTIIVTEYNSPPYAHFKLLCDTKSMTEPFNQKFLYGFRSIRSSIWK